MSQEIHHIHFVGICGVAMSALALAFKNAGYLVTGSDAGFYPPISTYLKNNQINFYPGWHPEKMITPTIPDLTIVGNIASSTNPELLYLKNKQMNYCSYPEALARFFVKNNSIVCAGTYGKTTISALLSFILKTANFQPSYMFGGLISENFFPAAQINIGDWSILEGDEYKTSKNNNLAKFFFYHPTHLVLSAVEWDHIDLYPSAAAYQNTFQKLVASVPANGLIVASEKITHDILQPSRAHIVRYGKNNDNQYTYRYKTTSPQTNKVEIIEKNTTHIIISHLLGEYNAENICGAFALAREIKIAPTTIITAITNFPGLKRRLEKRGTINNADIYDDIAHSPVKAEAVLNNLRQIYSTKKIYAIFEPNTGHRQITAASQYQNAFTAADVVMIPPLSKIKKTTTPTLTGEDIARIIACQHPNTHYYKDDRTLINYLKENTTAGDAVVFLGSHGFRGMIEELISPHP